MPQGPVSVSIQPPRRPSAPESSPFERGYLSSQSPSICTPDSHQTTIVAKEEPELKLSSLPSTADLSIPSLQQDGTSSGASSQPDSPSAMHVAKRPRIINSGSDLLEEMRERYSYVKGASIYDPPTRPTSQMPSPTGQVDQSFNFPSQHQQHQDIKPQMLPAHHVSGMQQPSHSAAGPSYHGNPVSAAAGCPDDMMGGYEQNVRYKRQQGQQNMPPSNYSGQQQQHHQQGWGYNNTSSQNRSHHYMQQQHPQNTYGSMHHVPAHPSHIGGHHADHHHQHQHHQHQHQIPAHHNMPPPQAGHHSANYAAQSAIPPAARGSPHPNLLNSAQTFSVNQPLGSQLPPHQQPLLPADPSKPMTAQQGLMHSIINDGSSAFRSHPLFPLLRDLIIADMNFHTPSFPFQLIANLPAGK